MKKNKNETSCGDKEEFYTPCPVFLDRINKAIVTPVNSPPLPLADFVSRKSFWPRDSHPEACTQRQRQCVEGTTCQ